MRLNSLRASRWRAGALAVLMVSLCAAAQQNPAPTPATASANSAFISAEQTLTRVRELRAAGRFAAALEPLERYLAADPRNTVVRLEYARTLAVLRRFPEAAREYQRVLESEPQNAGAMVGMAKVAAWQGQNQLALETYDRVLARRPTHYDAVVGKAFLLLWMGRQVEARSLFLEAQRQHPNDREVREALASSGAPAESDGAAAQPAGSEVAKPAASDAPGAPPAEAPAPAPVKAAAPAPVETPPSSAAAFEPAVAAPAGSQSVIPAGEEPSQPVSQPKSGTPLRPRAAHKGSADAMLVVRQGPRPAPNGSLPAHVPLAISAQLAMLGMFATVVGAIAYRTYRVRRRPVPLAARRVLELPPSSLPPPRPASTGRGNPLAGRVLFVHPHGAVRDFAQRVLAGAGAEALVLGRGEEAIAGLEKWPYDAVVASDHLPEGWSGREIYRWLERNQPGAERSFVLVLTGEPDAEMQVFLDESRPLSLVAPFGVSDLLAMTRLAMGRPRAQA